MIKKFSVVLLSLLFLQNAYEGYVHNAYGLLRSPWNLDPSPFVTRHNATNGQASRCNLIVRVI